MKNETKAIDEIQPTSDNKNKINVNPEYLIENKKDSKNDQLNTLQKAVLNLDNKNSVRMNYFKKSNKNYKSNTIILTKNPLYKNKNKNDNNIETAPKKLINSINIKNYTDIDTENENRSNSSTYNKKNNLISENKVKSLNSKKKSSISGKLKVKNSIFLKNEMSSDPNSSKEDIKHVKEEKKEINSRYKQLSQENEGSKNRFSDYKSINEIIKSSEENLLANKLDNFRESGKNDISDENTNSENDNKKESSNILNIMREYKKKMREEKLKTTNLKTLIEEQQKKIKNYKEKFIDIQKKNKSLIKRLNDMKLANKESHTNITIKEENSILFNDSKSNSNISTINNFSNETFLKISEENKKLRTEINEEKVKNDILKIIAEEERKKVKGLKELILKDRKKKEVSKEKEKEKKENDIEKNNRIHLEEVKNLNKIIKELKEELSSVKDNYKSKENNYVNNINNLNEKIQKLKKEITKLNNTITELNKTNKDINNKLQSYMVKYNNLCDKDRKTTSQKIVIEAKDTNQNSKFKRGCERKIGTGRFGTEETKELGAIIKEEISKKEKENIKIRIGDNNVENFGINDCLIFDDDDEEEEDIDGNSDEVEVYLEDKKEDSKNEEEKKNGNWSRSSNKNLDKLGEDNIKIRTILET